MQLEVTNQYRTWDPLNLLFISISHSFSLTALKISPFPAWRWLKKIRFCRELISFLLKSSVCLCCILWLLMYRKELCYTEKEGQSKQWLYTDSFSSDISKSSPAKTSTPDDTVQINRSHAITGCRCIQRAMGTGRRRGWRRLQVSLFLTTCYW